MKLIKIAIITMIFTRAVFGQYKHGFLNIENYKDKSHNIYLGVSI